MGNDARNANSLRFDAPSVMSEQDFKDWGANDVAYVKRLDPGKNAGWAIFSADGGSLGIADNRSLAFAVIRQNDMAPLSVH